MTYGANALRVGLEVERHKTWASGGSQGPSRPDHGGGVGGVAVGTWVLQSVALAPPLAVDRLAEKLFNISDSKPSSGTSSLCGGEGGE